MSDRHEKHEMMKYLTQNERTVDSSKAQLPQPKPKVSLLQTCSKHTKRNFGQVKGHSQSRPETDMCPVSLVVCNEGEERMMKSSLRNKSLEKFLRVMVNFAGISVIFLSFFHSIFSISAVPHAV